MPKTRPNATCHPDRPHWAKGLCASCYQTAWKRQNPEKFAARPRRMSECHPDRPVLAGNLCSTCYRQEWRKDPANRDREREWKRKSQRKWGPEDRFRRVLNRYKMTVDDWHDRLIAQSGRCAACNDAHPDLQVDHCHETGEVRGLLCPNCNSALGHARDDAVRLRALIAYLGTSRSASRGLQLDREHP